VTAPSIGTMTVKGNLAADVTVSGAGVVAGKPALATLKATGAVSGDITVSGLLNAVQTGGFNGTLTAGWVGSMSVKGDLNGPVTLTGSGLPTGKVALRSLTVTGAVRPAGTVTAPSIGTLSVTGDLGADVTISGAGVAAGKAALNSLKVKGAVTGRDIRVGGNVTSVSAGRFLDSRLFAGYDGPDDGGGAFSATPATVKSFRVTGATDAFANSTVIAAAFKAVTLQSVRGENGDDLFGFVANDSIGSLKVASLAFAYDPFLTLPQGFDDFEVKVL
jgi:cytoskeletal protein CcmA (bactofilin family)